MFFSQNMDLKRFFLSKIEYGVKKNKNPNSLFFNKIFINIFSENQKTLELKDDINSITKCKS